MIIEILEEPRMSIIHDQEHRAVVVLVLLLRTAVVLPALMVVKCLRPVQVDLDMVLQVPVTQVE